MGRRSPYVLLYIIVMLLQSFLFNSLTISIALTPLIYIAFLLFLPIRTSQLNMLLFGALLGISADLSMGLAGVNTIVTIFMAYVRIHIFSLLLVGDIREQDDMVLYQTVKRVSFWRQTMIFFIFTLIYHTLFFMVETLSVSPLLFWIVRTFFSSVVTTIFVVLLYDIFRRLFFNSKKN